jgi:hypothetical protein
MWYAIQNELQQLKLYSTSVLYCRSVTIRYQFHFYVQELCFITKIRLKGGNLVTKICMVIFYGFQNVIIVLDNCRLYEKSELPVI